MIKHFRKKTLYEHPSPLNLSLLFLRNLSLIPTLSISVQQRIEKIVVERINQKQINKVLCRLKVFRLLLKLIDLLKVTNIDRKEEIGQN
jgi:hypothetical protein